MPFSLSLFLSRYCVIINTLRAADGGTRAFRSRAMSDDTCPTALAIVS